MLSPLQGALGPLGQSRRTAAQSSLLTGLGAYWKLDEASGDAADSSGNGRTLTNTGTVTYGAGKIGNGAIFAGSTAQKLARAANTDLSHANGLGVSLWVKPTALSGYQWLINRDDVNIAREWSIYLSGAGVIVEVFASSGGYVWTNTGGFQAGVWAHVTVSFSTVDRKVRLRVNNGAEQVTGALGAHVAKSSELRLGLRGTGAYPLNGMLDEVGVWTRPFIEDEYTTLQNGGAGKTPPFT